MTTASVSLVVAVTVRALKGREMETSSSTLVTMMATKWRRVVGSTSFELVLVSESDATHLLFVRMFFNPYLFVIFLSVN